MDQATVDTAGNVLTFANDVFGSADKKTVGSDQGYCVRIVGGKAWESRRRSARAGIVVATDNVVAAETARSATELRSSLVTTGQDLANVQQR